MNLAATMSLDNRGFMDPLSRSRSAFAGMRSALEGLAGPLAALGVSFGAFKSVEGIVEGFKGVFVLGKELKAQSAITGQSIRDVVILRKAYDEAGMDAGSLTANLSMLQAALGGVNEEGLPTKHIFEQLGLDMEALKSKRAIEQFDEIAKAIGNLGDQSSKMAAVRGIFGRAGAQMLALFANPKVIEEASELVGKQANIFQKNAETFAKVTNAFEAVGTKVRGIFVGAAAEAAPAIMPILTALRSIDTVGMSQRLGAVLRQSAQLLQAAYKSGNLSELISLSLTVGFEKAVPKIGSLLVNAFSAPIAYLQAGLEKAAELWKIRTSGEGGLSMKEKSTLQNAYRNIDSQQADASAALERGNKGLAKELMQSVSEWIKVRDELENKANLEKNLEDIPTRMKRIMGEGVQFDLFGLGKGNGASAAERTLRDLMARLSKSFAPLNIPIETTPAAGTAGFENVKDYGAGKAARKGRFEDGDKLARIGLFVGGSGGPALEHARKTADNTTKLVALTAQVHATITNSMRQQLESLPAWGI